MLTSADRAAIVLALAALPFVYHHAWSARGAADTVVITSAEGTLQLPLLRDAEVTVQGRLGPTRVEIRDGRARFVDSPCPARLCVLGGWHTHTGETAACLPNGVSLRLRGARPVYDAVNF